MPQPEQYLESSARPPEEGSPIVESVMMIPRFRPTFDHRRDMGNDGHYGDQLALRFGVAPGKCPPQTKLTRNKTRNKNEEGTRLKLPQAAHRRIREMVRLARESLALVSVASFVWMVCVVAMQLG